MSENLSESNEYCERTAAPVWPASSLLAIRKAAGILEVLLLKRAETLRFLPGFLSYPGGRLDQEDHDLARHFQFGETARTPLVDLAFVAAALRECAEETGIAVGLKKCGGSPGAARLTAGEQADLLANRVTLRQVFQQHGWRADGERVRFVGRWITPPNMPARFDTRFFVTIVEEAGIEANVDARESSWGKWREPQTVLAEIEAGRAKAAAPTIAMLQALDKYQDAEECFFHLNVPGPNPNDFIEMAEKLKRP